VQVFGRRPPQRVDSLVMPASENLHNRGSRASEAASQVSWNAGVGGSVRP